jgi:hypothetical protein
MDSLKILSYSLMFLVGFLSCILVVGFLNYNTEKPLSINGLVLMNNQHNESAPSDWIKEGDIVTYGDKVIINVKGASISSYADTGSMRPVLDKDSNGIRIVPQSPDQIKIGDIVTYEKDGSLIVHRIIEEGTDNNGSWFVTKGDNNDFQDSRIYFKDIRYVTIGVLW